MQKEIEVYIDLNGEQHFVGHLWARVRHGRESASFEYAKTWLNRSNAFALEPALMLVRGAQHTAGKKTIFGAFSDSAPDRWGRLLMRRAQRQQLSGTKTLMEIDYLLGVSDISRQGALRFRDVKSGVFLADTASGIPPLVALPRLLSATEHVINHRESAEDLALLFAPGSSVGGARPKAVIQDKNRHLAIAKFPHQQDEFNVVLWEAVALKLAKSAGIHVPKWRIETVAGKSVLISERFDRKKTHRIPYLSAMSFLGAADNEQRSYLELVDIIKQYGSHTKEDSEQLWRRMLFNILISNTDDHLRNHGFLYESALGWRLSPAFDLVPTPEVIKPRILSTAIDLNDVTASLELALSVADYFNLTASQANSIVAQVAKAVSRWRNTAKQLQISASEIQRMASAFEHSDLLNALKKT